MTEKNTASNQTHASLTGGIFSFLPMFIGSIIKRMAVYLLLW